jgi:hypothetical protein
MIQQIASFGQVSDDGPQYLGITHALPGSELAALIARAGALLEAASLTRSCPHPPSGDDVLVVPSGLFGCEPCLVQLQRELDERAGHAQAACCGAPATGEARGVVGPVIMVLRLCDQHRGPASAYFQSFN